MCSGMLKTLNIRLTCHQEHVNYGVFLDRHVLCIQPCSRTGLSTRVKNVFYQHVPLLFPSDPTWEHKIGMVIQTYDIDSPPALLTHVGS
jgi:hypothetical protein